MWLVRTEHEENMADTFDPEAGDVRGETVNIREGSARNVYAGSVTLTMGSAQNVSAESVTIRQAGAQSIEAQTISIKQGGALRMDAGRVDAAAAAIGVIRAEEVNVGPSCQVVGTLAGTVTIEESIAPVIVARGSAHLDQSAAGVLVSNRITLNNSAAVLAVAETINGDVRMQVRPQVAAVFGAALGAALGVTVLLGRRGR